MEKEYNYIYKTTCKVNNTYYYGMHSTNNLEDGYLGSGLRLIKSLNKYGVDNHEKEILEYLDSRVELINREKEIITKEFIDSEFCMNLMPGGRGGFISKEQQARRSSAAGKSNWKRIKADEKLFSEFKIIQRGRLEKLRKEGKLDHTEESKRKIGEANKVSNLGGRNSQFGTHWIHKDGFNKKIKSQDLMQFIELGWTKKRVIGAPPSYGIGQQFESVYCH